MSDETKSCCPTGTGEPTATRSAAPMWIIVVTLILLFTGGYYFDQHGGWGSAQVYAPFTSSDQLAAYQPSTGGMNPAIGRAKYEANCGICHGNDGAGKPGQAPALAGSDLVTGGKNRLIHIPLQGLNGPITINGKVETYSAGMVAVGLGISDSDLAAALSHIRTSWGNKAEEITAEDVKAARDHLPKDALPLTDAQLRAIKE